MIITVSQNGQHRPDLCPLQQLVFPRSQVQHFDSRLQFLTNQFRNSKKVKKSQILQSLGMRGKGFLVLPKSRIRHQVSEKSEYLW
jgi:hypothetical protein